MEKKKDVPNAGDEIRKLREALARKGKYRSSADELTANKRASRQDCDEADDAEPDDKDEQTANNFAARRPTSANPKG